MKTIKEEICECGHKEGKHYISVYMEAGCYPREKCFIKNCPCKKFKSR